jgi:MerR family regulatory protein
MTPADDPGQAPADDPGQLLAVGDLARATGLTVRTLHHYDRLGLLSPVRDAGGRRRYGPAEARRGAAAAALAAGRDLRPGLAGRRGNRTSVRRTR